MKEKRLLFRGMGIVHVYWCTIFHNKQNMPGHSLVQNNEEWKMPA